MIRICFSATCGAKLSVVEETLGSTGYCTILENVLFPFAEDKHSHGWSFHKDNASIHTSNYIEQFFLDTDTEVLEWPSHSLDLNSTENL